MATEESSLVGRVIDGQGHPVGDVEVRVEPGPCTTTTDAEGGFAFDGLASRTYAVTARKDDLYAWPTRVDLRAPSPPLTLQLRLGVTYVVNVYGGRAPVVAARLRLSHGIEASTDEAGRAVVRGLAPDLYVGVLVADGWADEHLMLSLRDDPGGIVERTLHLEPGARIEGVVLDARGGPVADAVVRAWGDKKNRRPYATWSATDGTWRLGARTGTYRVSAESRAHGRSPQLCFASDGCTPQRDLVLRVGPEPVIARVVDAAKRLLGANTPLTISGIVVCEDGTPVAAADVRVRLRQPVRADSNGRFEVEGLDPGEYEIVAARVGPWSAPPASAVRRVRAGETDVRLVLPSGATVTGRALLDGKPLPYFGLQLVPEGMTPSGGPSIGVRDEAGRFTLHHVPAGTWRVGLIARGTRLAISTAFTVTGTASVDLGDIVLVRGQRLSGRVLDHTGAAVAGARVFVGRSTSRRDDRSHLERLFLRHDETTTDDAGVYVFEGIDVHREPMRVCEIAWATHVAAGASVIHELPTTDATMDFVLLGCGRIAGRVENMRGGRGFLRAIRADEPPSARLAHCDDEGRFWFEKLPPGEYAVELLVPEPERVPPAIVTVVANETVTATLAMTSVSVQLHVRVPGGRGRDLEIEPTSEGAGIGGRIHGIGVRGDEDICYFQYVRPGTYRMSLDGKQWTAVTIDASPATQTIDLRHLG